MLVARVTLTGSRFLFSLLYARVYLSHPVCLAGRRRRRRTKKRLLRWKREREQIVSYSLIYITNNNAYCQKKENWRNIWQTVSKKKRSPFVGNFTISLLLLLLFLRVVDERTLRLYNIYIYIYMYMPVCHYWLNPYWWFCLEYRLHTFLTGARQKNGSKRMNKWKKKGRKETKITDKEFQCLKVHVLCLC